MAFNIVDTWFVAQLGEKELAAMSFTFPVVMTLISVGIGLMAGTASIIARVMGKGDMSRVRRLTTDAVLLGILISIIFSIIGLLTMDWVFLALGADASILPLIKQYMTPWYYGFIFMLVPMVGLGAIRATGDSKIQSQIMIMASVVNLILDPLLIFGLLGFPKLGIEGAAWATVIARGASFVLGFWVLRYKKNMLEYSFPGYKIISESWKSILHVGLPAMGTNMLIPVAGGVVIAIVADFGANAVAGFGAATRIEQMTLIVFYAMSAMIGPFVGQNLGAGHYQRIRESIWLCARFCFISGIVIAIVLAVSGIFLMGLFSDHPEVIDVGAWYLWIVPISIGLEGLVMVVNAAFNGLGKPIPAMIISASRMFLLYVPLSYFLSRSFGIPGIFIGIALANCLSGAFALWWFNRHCRV